MMKVTVLYGNPESPDDFEKYNGTNHLPLAGKMKGVACVELTKFVATPDKGRPSFYRMAELYFTGQAEMYAFQLKLAKRKLMLQISRAGFRRRMNLSA